MFEDIEVGCKVLLAVKAGSMWCGESFLVAAEVSSVTAKGFKVGGRRFRKSDGKEIGAEFSAAHKYSDDKDQSSEFVAYRKKYTSAVRVADAARRLSVAVIMGMSDADVELLTKLLVKE